MTGLVSLSPRPRPELRTRLAGRPSSALQQERHRVCGEARTCASGLRPKESGCGTCTESPCRKDSAAQGDGMGHAGPIAVRSRGWPPRGRDAHGSPRGRTPALLPPRLAASPRITFAEPSVSARLGGGPGVWTAQDQLGGRARRQAVCRRPLSPCDTS